MREGECAVLFRRTAHPLPLALRPLLSRVPAPARLEPHTTTRAALCALVRAA